MQDARPFLILFTSRPQFWFNMAADHCLQFLFTVLIELHELTKMFGGLLKHLVQADCNTAEMLKLSTSTYKYVRLAKRTCSITSFN